MTFLITSAGRRVSLVRFARDVVRRTLGSDAQVLAVDLQPELSPACRAADRAVPVGRFADPDYMDRLLQLCLTHGSQLVVPTIDPELAMNAQQRQSFAQHGVYLIVSDWELVQKCRDKRLTVDLFRQQGLATPKLLKPPLHRFPVFVKPINGSSSTDLHILRREADVRPELLDAERYLPMEYLSPEEFREYTIDLYYGRDQLLKCAVPRERIATRAGEVSKGITRRGNVYAQVIERFRSLPGARGCVTLQLFESRANGDLFGIEINPRFGGGYPLTHLAGANYLQWLVEEYLFERSVPFFDGWKENTLLLRSDEEHVVYDFAYSS